MLQAPNLPGPWLPCMPTRASTADASRPAPYGTPPATPPSPEPYLVLRVGVVLHGNDHRVGRRLERVLADRLDALLQTVFRQVAGRVVCRVRMRSWPLETELFDEVLIGGYVGAGRRLVFGRAALHGAGRA